MKEEILRIYWQVYTDGCSCLKNWDKVDEKTIEAMTAKHQIGVMRRVFTLAGLRRNPENQRGYDSIAATDVSGHFRGCLELFQGAL